MSDKKMISEKESIALLLFLVEDLKEKLFDGVALKGYQTMVLNSMIHAICENHVLPLKKEEFEKMVIKTDGRPIIYYNGNGEVNL